MTSSSARRLGLGIFGLLSLRHLSTIFLTDGDPPPYVVAGVALVLGVVSLVLTARAMRDPSRPLRLLIALRILSAVTALPAFFAGHVPGAATVAAATIVVLTAVAVLLTARGRVGAVAS